MPDPSLLLQSLEGLTIGDQLGETFFLDGKEAELIAARALRPLGEPAGNVNRST